MRIRFVFGFVFGCCFGFIFCFRVLFCACFRPFPSVSVSPFLSPFRFWLCPCLCCFPLSFPCPLLRFFVACLSSFFRFRVFPFCFSCVSFLPFAWVLGASVDRAPCGSGQTLVVWLALRQLLQGLSFRRGLEAQGRPGFLFFVSPFVFRFLLRRPPGLVFRWRYALPFLSFCVLLYFSGSFFSILLFVLKFFGMGVGIFS